MDGFQPKTLADIPAPERPTVGEALLPILGVVVFLGVGSGILGLAPHAPLLWSIAFASLVGVGLIGFD